MSSSSPSSTPPPCRAPWRALFQSHLSKMPATEFNLGTVYQDANGKAYPRVRTCIFRGFFAEQELHPSAKKQLEETKAPQLASSCTSDKKQDEEGFESCLNPMMYESDLLTLTTDVRMEKVGQIVGGGGGGGGEVECVFWVKDVMTQWRVKGKAFVLSGDGGVAGEMQTRVEIGKWMRLRDGEKEGGCRNLPKGSSWSWEKEVTAHFANLSPIMRGSFKNPPPGTPITDPIPNPSLKFGQKVFDLHDHVARKNFRVVVIQPEEVEYIDLEDGKRVRWRLLAGGDSGSGEDKQVSWKEEELWP